MRLAQHVRQSKKNKMHNSDVVSESVSESSDGDGDEEEEEEDAGMYARVDHDHTWRRLLQPPCLLPARRRPATVASMQVYGHTKYFRCRYKGGGECSKPLSSLATHIQATNDTPYRSP